MLGFSAEFVVLSEVPLRILFPAGLNRPNPEFVVVTSPPRLDLRVVLPPGGLVEQLTSVSCFYLSQCWLLCLLRRWSLLLRLCLNVIKAGIF